MPVSRKDPYKPRKCLLCHGVFKPKDKNPANAMQQNFCSPAHRKEYWKHGALPFDKLMQRIEKRVREIVKEETNTAYIEGRNVAIDNAAMKAYDMGRPDIRDAINALVSRT